MKPPHTSQWAQIWKQYKWPFIALLALKILVVVLIALLITHHIIRKQKEESRT